MSWMDSPDARDFAEREEIERRTGVRIPPLWARDLLEQAGNDPNLVLAKMFTTARASDALAELFRVHVVSRYTELVAARTPVDAIDDPLFRVMLRLTHTANDGLHHGVGGGPSSAWSALWSVLREAPSSDIDDPADYFCAWFHAKQDDFWYPEPQFERFGVFTYWKGAVEAERFPGLMAKIENFSRGAQKLRGNQSKPAKRGWFRR